MKRFKSKMDEGTFGFSLVDIEDVISMIKHNVKDSGKQRKAFLAIVDKIQKNKLSIKDKDEIINLMSEYI